MGSRPILHAMEVTGKITAIWIVLCTFVLQILFSSVNFVFSSNYLSFRSISFVSGTSLLQSIGEPCDVSHGDDDCEEGLVCEVEDRSDVTGVCLSRSDLGKPWYVSSEAQICVQDCEVGPNCGGRAQDYNELFATPELCCGTMLSYMNFRVCIPDWNAL